MIVQESARGMMQCSGSEKVPTTPITPKAVRQDLDQKTSTDYDNGFWSHSNFGCIKYTRYLNCFTGKSVIVTDLGIFSPVGGTRAVREKVCELHILTTKLYKTETPRLLWLMCKIATLQIIGVSPKTVII